MSDACLVCDEVTGRLPVPGGFLLQDDHLVVFHCPVVPPATDVYAGYLFITPVRHAAGFGDLDDEEAAAVGVAIARWSRALEAPGAEHVYVLRVGHGVPHLHVHLIPRWPGTPADVSWLNVDEWPGARRGDSAFAASITAALHRPTSGDHATH